MLKRHQSVPQSLVNIWLGSHQLEVAKPTRGLAGNGPEALCVPEPGSGMETLFRQWAGLAEGPCGPPTWFSVPDPDFSVVWGGWLGVPGLSRSDKWWGTRGRVPGPNPEHRAGGQGWISAGHLASWRSLASPSQVPHEGSLRRAQ